MTTVDMCLVEPYNVSYNKNMNITTFLLGGDMFYLINHQHINHKLVREGRLVSFTARKHGYDFDNNRAMYIIENNTFTLKSSIKKVLNKYEVAIKVIGAEEMTCKQVALTYGVSSDIIRRHVHSALKDVNTGVKPGANISTLRYFRHKFIGE